MVRTFMAQPAGEDAQVTLARRMFWAGCLGLPWLHAVNVCYFWPKVFSPARATRAARGARGAAGGAGAAGGDVNPELLKWVSRSLVGAVVGFLLLAAWILFFQLRWKAWGSRVLPFMITAPDHYTTGW